ncbi:MAG TPA: hemerythrin domain-containing protein [Candidatus Cybelea sp.]|nr:hemerythrin domain-containing protein [Candidatus Cybelea sp.]
MPARKNARAKTSRKTAGKRNGRSNEMDAVALLKADHRKVEELFEKFESSRGESSKQKIAQQICMELMIHTVIEEEIFYPSCAGQIEDEELVQEAYVEHDGAKVLIAEILASQPSDEFWEAKVTVLSEMIKHHVNEEEKRSEGLFAEAKAAGLDLEELGQRMQARKMELMEEFKSGELPPPQTRSFHGHELTQGEPVEAAM